MTQNSWNNQVTAAGVTFNGGVTNIGSDAAANAINIGTGAAAKTITIGNVTGATALAMNTGTGDFTLASATGTVISALDTGEITKPLQPAFLAISTGVDNVTGNAVVYDIVFASEIFDQGADFDGSTTFTAPVTGKYQFSFCVWLSGLAAANTTGYLYLITSNRNFSFSNNIGGIRNVNDEATQSGALIVDMDAADTCKLQTQVLEGTQVVDINATDGRTCLSGFLVC